MLNIKNCQINRNILQHVIAILFLFLQCFLNGAHAQAPSTSSTPLPLAIAGITHTHVYWILSRKKSDVELVGIYEPNNELAKRLVKQFGLDASLIYNDLGKILDAVKPEAVAAFGSIYEHMKVVEAAAPRHIDVMVEKPLATTLQQALQMETLAKKYNIRLLTNFETSWYPTTVKTYELVKDSNYIGQIKKS